MPASKFGPEVCAQIVQDVQSGLPVKTAAERARVKFGSVYEWIKKGVDGNPKYEDFALDVLAARAENLKVYVDVINRHALAFDSDNTPLGDPKLCLQMLERLAPTEFRPERIVHHLQLNEGEGEQSAERTIVQFIASDEVERKALSSGD